MGKYEYYDDFLETMLREISDKYDTTPGAPIYDICSGCAMIAAEQYDELMVAVNQLDPKNRTDADLDSYIFDHSGLERKDGVYAQVDLTITGTCTISSDHYFSTATGIAFRPIAQYSIVTSGTVACECVLQGSRGNVAAGTITICNQSVVGLKSVTNESPATGGVTRESDEDFLERYYEYIRKPQGSGTVADIKQEVESIEGVGSCTVTPDRENAIATITITDSDGGLPSTALIDLVQETIDPKGTDDATWGCGYGIAPIGLRLDVVTPTSVTVYPLIWLTDATAVDATAFSSYLADNLYKTSDWLSCMDDSMIDYLAMYNAIQSALNDYADLNGMSSSSVNIRKFAFKVSGNALTYYSDYAYSSRSVVSGGSATISKV